MTLEPERILAVDVGQGTTDILIYEPGQTDENSVKLVLPSRTQVVAAEIRAATVRGLPVVFHGPTMGGGPSTAAMRDHLSAGLAFLATESAALTFADDLERVIRRGLHLIGADEVATALRGGHVEVRSCDLLVGELLESLRRLGAPAEFSGACIAVQDHGFSPHGSNRVFRFDSWRAAIADERPILSLFYEPQEVPAEFTRLRAAATSLEAVPRVLAADTGPAALYGALPPNVTDAMLVNVGNGHTICVVARRGRLAGVFEHHTGRLDEASLEALLRRFLAGKLSDDEVREGGGHGAVCDGPVPAALPVFVTGPRRRLLAGSSLAVTFAAPFGDMMMAGPAGLIRAYRERHGL